MKDEDFSIQNQEVVPQSSNSCDDFVGYNNSNLPPDYIYGASCKEENPVCLVNIVYYVAFNYSLERRGVPEMEYCTRGAQLLAVPLAINLSSGVLQIS